MTAPTPAEVAQMLPVLDFALVCDGNKCEHRATWAATTREDVAPDLLLMCDRHFEQVTSGQHRTTVNGVMIPTRDLIVGWRRI